MSDQNEREITKKVTSTSNTPSDEYRVSERTTRVSNDNSGIILGVLIVLGLGVGAGLYFLNNRPASTIFVPGATNTIKENKSTVIERNNTTTKEASPQPAKVEINVPAPVVPKVEVNVPAPTVTTQPIVPTPSPTPSSNSNSAN